MGGGGCEGDASDERNGAEEEKDAHVVQWVECDEKGCLGMFKKCLKLRTCEGRGGRTAGGVIFRGPEDSSFLSEVFTKMRQIPTDTVPFS